MIHDYGRQCGRDERTIVRSTRRLHTAINSGVGFAGDAAEFTKFEKRVILLCAFGIGAFGRM